ncbi:MAG: class II aldolase/adducin family protein [candidate division NC10 bacterium]
MSILADEKALAEELSRYSRLCYARRLVGAAGGNVSVRVPGQELALITATGVSLRDVGPENLLVVDLRGGVVENPAGLRPSKETGFHLGIYQARADVRAVVHVHPTYSTVYGNIHTPIPLATVSAENKLRQGPVVPAAAGGSGDLETMLLEAIAAAPTANVFLMERHGLTAFGPTLCQAFDDAELAEDTAKIAFLVGLAQPGSV